MWYIWKYGTARVSYRPMEGLISAPSAAFDLFFGGGGVTTYIWHIRMCVRNSPFFQRRQVYDKTLF